MIPPTLWTEAPGKAFRQNTDKTRDIFPHHDSITRKWVKLQDRLKKESIVRSVGNSARQDNPTGTSADHLVQGAESIDVSVQASIGKSVTVISEVSHTGTRQTYDPQNFNASMVSSTAPT